MGETCSRLKNLCSNKPLVYTFVILKLGLKRSYSPCCVPNKFSPRRWRVLRLNLCADKDVNVPFPGLLDHQLAREPGEKNLSYAADMPWVKKKNGSSAGWVKNIKHS